MKEKINIPGAAKAMYLIYLGALVVALYTGFNTFGLFLQGWRYPWATSFAADLNFAAVWTLGLVSFVYLYYVSLGRPRGWHEPLVWARVLLALVAIWFFFLSYAVLFPQGWMSWLVDWLGGLESTFKVYRVFLPVMVILNSLYLLAYYFVRQLGGHAEAAAPKEVA